MPYPASIPALVAGSGTSQGLTLRYLMRYQCLGVILSFHYHPMEKFFIIGILSLLFLAAAIVIILILVFLFVFTTERHQKTLLFDAVRYWIISYQHTANLTSSWGLPPWSTIHTLRQERRARAKCWKNNHRCRNSHSTRPAPPRPETHLCWSQLQPSGRKKSQKPGSSLLV